MGAIIILVAGCAQWLPVSPTAPPHAAARTQPSDWFHQQLAMARAAKRAHQPKADKVGAQLAYDDVMRTACTQAALAGRGKYPARCDAVLHPTAAQPSTDPCDEDAENPALQTECSD